MFFMLCILYPPGTTYQSVFVVNAVQPITTFHTSCLFNGQFCRQLECKQSRENIAVEATTILASDTEYVIDNHSLALFNECC